MPLEVRSRPDQQLMHQNRLVAADFQSPELVEQARELDTAQGHGYQAHWFFEGIRMAYARWRYHAAPVETDWLTDLDVVHLHVNLRGRTCISDHRSGQHTRLGGYQHTLAYHPGFAGTLRHEELESETFILQFTRPAFLALAAQANEPLRHLAACIEAGRPAPATPPLHLHLPLHQAIRAVLDCRVPGPLRQLYLRAKALEILVLQAEALERATQQPLRTVRTEYDQERLLFARDYLIQHAQLPPTLPELARIAGLNECKLKRGFKEQFGLTVFGYLAEYRLHEARNQLIGTQKTASELAFELGYSSLQHFSAAFKKRFGVSPRELRAA